MPSPADHLSSSLAGRYHIERELGEGGMSRVFLAREHGLNREVVIKVLSADVAGLPIRQVAEGPAGAALLARVENW